MNDLNSGSIPSKNYIHRFSVFITESLESFFYRLGLSIAQKPIHYIIACLIFTSLCSIGLIGFTLENRPDKLWIPWNSDFINDTTWLRENFPSPIRFQSLILVAEEDVLEPHVFKWLYKLHNDIENVKAQVGKGNVEFSWKDLCFRLPVTKFESTQSNQIVNDLSDEFNDDFFGGNTDSSNTSTKMLSRNFDPSVDLPQEIYCNLLEYLKQECWESNVLEYWGFNSTQIDVLSKSDILSKFNSKTLPLSPIFGRPINYTTEISGIIRNETNGQILGAKALFLRWFVKINQTAIKTGNLQYDRGTGEVVDPNTLAWEESLSKLLRDYTENGNVPQGLQLYFYLGRSFGDIAESTIWNDARMFAVGFTIVFIYVVLMLGKFNMVEQRPLLSLMGLSCIGLGIVVSYGVCSAINLIYGPVHNILPFLLLGIGIDDMFVIMECYYNLSPMEQKKPIPERIGLTLKHAGVSITVTSVTDFSAFVIGGTTVLPALQSFCIYAAIGIIATYLFQILFFTSWLSLDLRRSDQYRNAFIICYKHEQVPKNEGKHAGLAKRFFGGTYSTVLCKPLVKIFVISITLGFFTLGIYGHTQLRQEFNPIWFLPQDSYLFQYYKTRDIYFPGRGAEALLIIDSVPYHRNLNQMDQLLENLENSKSIYELDAWYFGFENYTKSNFNFDVSTRNITKKKFDKYLSRYLHSPTGAKYRGRFRFDGNLTCGIPAPPVLTTAIQFKFHTFKGPEEHLPAMNEVKSYVKNAKFEADVPVRAFIWSFAFAGWETDEIITVELYRNMGLAMICVFLATLILIANFRTCLLVLLCVVLTLVDVLGGMHFWNLTIDTVSCVDLVLAIGLCVDYAAHIGLAFMTSTGTRNQRVKSALGNIGPAVLNGGFSTFLAFILLANSKSHVFLTFFKVFFLVVTFGLFHGLVFLPVMLSIIGPPPYKSARKQSLGNADGDMHRVMLSQAQEPQNGNCNMNELSKTNGSGIHCHCEDALNGEELMNLT